MRDALGEYLALEPCSSEEVAALMQGRFGALRVKMQRQIGECLARAEARDLVIDVNDGEPGSLPAVTDLALTERSLPLLETGSLPVRRDDATTPLAPSALLVGSAPPGTRAHGSLGGRSRAITFAEDSSVPGASRRWLVIGGLLLGATLGVLWLRKPGLPSALPAKAMLQNRALPRPEELILRLHGSNTIGQDLAPRLAEAFLKQQGYDAVERGAPGERSIVSARDPRDGKPRAIEIVAQGSSTAFVDLAEGNCDVGLSSRRIKPEEASKLRERGLGDLESAAGEHVLGLDGIAVIVHPNSPLLRIDLESLRRVFTGESADLSALGGATAPIHLYARDDRSGTFDTFKHLVLGDGAIASSALRFADSAELSGAVARDPQGIGFIGIPYVRGARALAVGARGASSLFPSAFTVATEGYELSRRLYLYLPVENVRALALEFVNFALSGQGQEVVKASGFVDLTLRALEPGPCERCPARYAALSRTGRRLSLDFRFRSGSSELDNRGLRDLDRLLAFLRESTPGRLVLVGFSDARGGAAQNARLSLERAQKIAQQLHERGVNAVDIEAMGSELPVASNDTDSGREKNRRVEVWLR